MSLGSRNTRGLIKIFGWAAVLAGVFVLVIDQSNGAELLLLAGLFILLISHEVREDERSVSLKASSTPMALVVGYAITLLALTSTITR